jgi:hypothetical protein
MCLNEIHDDDDDNNNNNNNNKGKGAIPVTSHEGP